MAALALTINAPAQTTGLNCTQTDSNANCSYTVSNIKPEWPNVKKGRAAAMPASTLKYKNSCKMADNTMFIIKDGFTMVMASDIMLKNGVVILANGVVVDNDGKKSQLKNGESINMQGLVYLTGKDNTKQEAAR